MIAYKNFKFLAALILILLIVVCVNFVVKLIIGCIIFSLLTAPYKIPLNLKAVPFCSMPAIFGR